jgi:hypothetical protein
VVLAVEMAKDTSAFHQGAALMKRTTKYGGLVVHQATTVASVREERARLIARRIGATEKDALLEFIGGLMGAAPAAW